MALKRRFTHSFLVTVFCLAAVVLNVPAKAQTGIPVATTQFAFTGFIQQATVDSPGDVFSGGTMTVNNVKMIVPYHTVLQMPAGAFTWQEIFALAPAPYTGLQTGWALQDVPTPNYTYEVNVAGNRLPNGQHIAGLIYLAQQSLHSGQGWITSINYATGEVTVDDTTRVKINDVIGRFSKGFGAAGPAGSPDQRFTIDEDNPTVRASSSYPMCIPRVAPPAIDGLCPQKNRRLDPLGKPLGFFTMTAPPANHLATNVENAYLMAPFEIGDFVSYSGAMMDDDGGTYVLAHTLIAELTLLTFPGSVPAYTAIDTLLMGVVSKAAAPAGFEGALRTRVEGWSTDSGGAVAQNIYAVDVEPCTGDEASPLRRWIDNLANPLTPFSIDVQTNAVGGAVGRWRFRPKAKDDSFLPPTRMVRARNASLSGDDRPVIVTPNGLRAGEYSAPVGEYIFSEAVPPGSAPPPWNNFENFNFLAQGEGPYPGNRGAVLGQLSPWPGTAIPTTFNSCAAAPPAPPTTPPVGSPDLDAQPDTLQLVSAVAPKAFTAADLLANDTGTGAFVRGVADFSVNGGTIAGTGPNFTFTPAAGFTGIDTFVYELGDAFGQSKMGTVSVLPIATDKTAPMVALTAPVTGTFSGAVNVAAIALDNVGVTSVQFVDGVTNIGAPVAGPGPAFSTSWNTVGVTNGLHIVTAIARDAAGNSAPSAGVSVTVSNNVIVPNVVNLAQAVASTNLTNAGLTAGAITTANSATVLLGNIISQNPLAGATVAPGSAVALVRSLGPAIVTVPNVVNLPQAVASTNLTNAGLTVGAITTANSATVLLGNIISQNPLAGTSVAPGSAVALVRSLGPVVAPGGTSAVFLSLDVTTQGGWLPPAPVYGTQGYMLANGPISLPAFAAVTTTGTAFTWIGSTADVRALQNLLPATDRFAATWFNPTTFNIDVNLTDGLTHQVAVYAVDWDSTIRAERIDVVDAVTGAILDSRTVTGFNGGQYIVWNVSGHVALRVTRTGGDNAVISAVFFN